MSNDHPWAGLEAGKVDTKRVDSKGRWNFFWAVMPRADAALVLQLSGLPQPLPELPKLKNLEIRFQTLPGGPILYVRLKDSAHLELFETLCRDVVSAAEIATTEIEALQRAIGRTFRWHYLLRGGRPGLLSEEAQKGLIGEFEVLTLLIDAIGAGPAVAAWTGPSGAPKDFELMGHCIEAKARRGAAQPFIRISSEHQLADVPGHALWLSVAAVERVHDPHGRMITDWAISLGSEIARLDPVAVTDWEIKLAETGLDPADDYSAWRWLSSPPTFYMVGQDFPRITAPVPQGVDNVSYSIGLSACTRFTHDWHDISRAICEGASP